ncbi:MAG: AEC family transporter [Lautropia sp.]|nr:AEC family transporter [Lautropia sp.]
MLSAILPVFLIILLGILTRYGGWLSDGFFAGAEKFSFHIAFPALLFSATAKLDIEGTTAAQLALGTLLPSAAIVLITLLGLLLNTSLPGPARSSVLQGALRPNSYFGIAVGSLLFPAQLTSLLALALALCLPVVNLVAVVALSWWSGRRPAIGTVVLAILRNPIIVATLAGLLWGRLGLPLPTAVAGTLDILGRAALCLGLLCVGAGLSFRREQARPMTLLITASLKLLLMPAIAVLVARLLHLPPEVATVACFYGALPTAPNAYIMARQMGGDAPLMAALITVQTLLAALTVPLCLSWLS